MQVLKNKYNAVFKKRVRKINKKKFNFIIKNKFLKKTYVLFDKESESAIKNRDSY